MTESHGIKQLLIDLTPLTVAIGGVSIAEVHQALSLVAVGASIIYTTFKIHRDFFKKK